MSALTRYPVPRAAAAGKADGPRLSFRLEPTIVPDPVLEFLQPLRGLESIKAGAVDDPRLYFRPEPATASRNFASEFDGANDWLSRSSNLSGIADSKTGLISFWYLSRKDDGASRQTMINGENSSGDIIRLQKSNISDRLTLIVLDRSTSTLLLQLNSLSEIKVTDGWTHILISWDLNTASSRAELYLDDVDDSDITTIVAPSGGDIQFKDGTAVNVYIKNDGNVGIGTTTPDQQLAITGSLQLPTTTSATTGVIYKKC